jgi:acetyl-CoA acetyltransferase
MISDQTALAGVGMTPIGRYPDRSALSLAVDAFKLALDDAGLQKSDVDGLMMMSFGADYDRFLETIGLDVRYAFQGWHHGRFLIAMVQQAALAINAGMADVIAIVHGSKGRRIGTLDGDPEILRQGLGPHGESAAYGAVSRAYGAAVSVQRYFHLYGGDNAALAPIAITLRQNAMLNEGAFRRQPMTFEDHQSSRWVVEPLRLFDCCQINDGGACVIVTSASRARDMPHAGALISGMQGVHAGPNYHNLAQPGLGVAQQEVFTYRAGPQLAYQMAGVERGDIQGLTVYDAFSPMVLFALERFGFCGPGEAMEFVKDGRIGIGGQLPVNTSGGLLSEGHLTGWNLLIEMVRQLRHDCGERQIKDAELLQWGSFLGESLILKRDR